MISKIVIVLFAVLVTAAAANAQEDAMVAVQRSHVDANVPDDRDFDTILRRDITAYVTDSKDKDIRVKVELLRDKATQAGVALPKFYIWIEKLDANGEVMEEAAARIAAVDKKKFDVIQYYAKARIIAEPDLMKKVFPDDVYEKILTKIKAGTK